MATHARASDTVKTRLSGPDQAPTVSVIVPAYNSAEFIAECLDSIFSQTFVDFEIIIVNDGSPDTPALEVALEPFRERIRYLQQENGGLSAARNFGIREARGEFVAFLDSDDCWTPEYLSTQMKLFRDNPALDLVYADAKLFGSPAPRKTFMQTSAPPTTLDGLLSERGQILPSGTVVKKRALVEGGFFDETLRRCEDVDMWLRLAQRGAKIAFQGDVLFLRRVHGRGLTADEEKMVSSVIYVLMKVDRAQLSAAGLQSLDKQLIRARGELGFMQWRRHLVEGDATAARQDLSAAHAFFRSRKFAWALLALRLAPRLMIWGARTFLRQRGFPRS